MNRRRHQAAFDFVRKPRGTRTRERVCVACQVMLGGRFRCPQCWGPTELRTLEKTGPFNAVTVLEVVEG